jgi:hypothetical protein
MAVFKMSKLDMLPLVRVCHSCWVSKVGNTGNLQRLADSYCPLPAEIKGQVVRQNPAAAAFLYSVLCHYTSQLAQNKWQSWCCASLSCAQLESK